MVSVSAPTRATTAPSGAATLTVRNAPLKVFAAWLRINYFFFFHSTDTTTKLITGSADSSAKLWDVEHGTELFTYNHQTSVRSVVFAMGDRVLFNITDAKMGKPAQIFIFDITEDRTNLFSFLPPLF